MIQSNASPDEKRSPYYDFNKSFCLEFEEFIKLNAGISKGKYNAWSYLIHGKITEPNQWVLEYKKSSFSSGNLLLSTESQSLFTSVLWKTKGLKNLDFLIRRKKPKDTFLKIFNRSISSFYTFENYVLVSETNTHKITEIASILKPLFLSKEIYQISNNNNELMIELRTDKHYFDIFNQLINFKTED